MSNPWKIIIAVVLTAGVVGAGTWYYVNMKAKNDKDALTIENTGLQKQLDELKKTTTTTETTTDTATTSDWKAYVNSKYNFGMTFTDTWKGVVVEAGAKDDALVTDEFDIWVPTADKTWTTTKAGYWKPLIISIYTKANWATAQANAQNPAEVPSLLAENATYVFAYSQAQAEPSDGAGIFAQITTVAKSLVIN